MTRIASFHQYDAVANDMMRQQTKVQKNHDELASSKRVITAGDDPLASINIQNFKQQNTELEQFLAAINLARNRQNLEEISISQAENLIDAGKNTVLKMINGSLSSADRKAYQQEMQSLFDHFFELANTQDESSNFIFSGTSSTEQPFFRDENANVNYVGNSFYRTAFIAPSIEVQTNDPGDRVFMQVKNPFGDYEPNYQLQSKSTLLLSKAVNADDEDKTSYEVLFLVDEDGSVFYELRQNNVIVATEAYDPNTGIEWNSLKLTFKGEMQNGDTIVFNNSENFSIFDAIKNAIDLAEKKSSDVSATAQLHVVIEQLSTAFIHMNQIRSEVGTRLNGLDRQEEMHKDYQVVLARSLGTMEDLDYSKAVIEMNENLQALQASQQAFARMKDLSLFNYV